MVTVFPDSPIRFPIVCAHLIRWHWHCSHQKVGSMSPLFKAEKTCHYSIRSAMGLPRLPVKTIQLPSDFLGNSHSYTSATILRESARHMEGPSVGTPVLSPTDSEHQPQGCKGGKPADDSSPPPPLDCNHLRDAEWKMPVSSQSSPGTMRNVNNKMSLWF